MNDHDKTKQQLVAELEELRRRLSTLEDVDTRRLQAEEALQAAHDELDGKIKRRIAELAIFQRFAESSGRGFGMTDLNGHITYVNPTLCRLFGEGKPEDVVGKHVSTYYPKEYVQRRAEEILPALLQSGSWQGEQAVCSRNGTLIPTLQDSFLIRDENGEPFRFAVAVTDIRKQKQAEEALRASEEKYRTLVETSPVGVIMTDVRGHVTFVSGKVLEDYRADRAEEIVGRNPLDFIAPHDHQRFLGNLRRTVEDGVTKNIEYDLLRKDGTIFPGEISAAVIKDASGRPSAIVAILQDLSERKRSQEALRAIYDGMPDGLLVTDIATKRFLRCNAAMRQMLGYTEEELLARSVTDIHPADELPSVLKAFHALVDGGQRMAQDIPILRKDGSVFHADITHNEMILDGQRCSAGFFRDITERRRAQDALRESHAELQAIYDGMADGLLMADTTTRRFLLANPAICSMLGYTEDELLALSVKDIHPTAELPTVLRAFEEQAAGRLRIAENLPVLRKDGSVFYADIVTSRLRNKEPACMIGIFRDTTERREAQEALRASTERYELAVRGAGVGIFDWNILTGKVYFSPRWKMLLGYQERDIGEGLEDWARLLAPDEREQILKLQEDFLAGRESTITAEYRLRHKDGSYRWIAAYGLVVRDAQGKACRLVGSHGDITDRKRAEEALERERQSLWKMLQASDHDRQIISYEIHDGLAQYLAAAGMQFQAFDALGEHSPDEARKTFDTAVELVRQAHCEARRLISGVRPPVLDEAGLETAIAHLIHDRRVLKGPKIEFKSDVQFGRMPSILENSLYRIAQEALTNACKHSKSQKATVTLTQEDRNLRLEVRDWGIGFNPEAVEQGHFGLESIRQRVRLLGGQLTIESQPGTGTLIQVVVPILESHAEG